MPALSSILAGGSRCQRLLERSRSGNGGHVWFFFEDAISASLARKLGSHVLTETMERRPEVGFGSYDRLFPNQDTLPKGGFGNLIALPLQKQARERGNTSFIDEQFKPYTDQWSLSGGAAKNQPGASRNSGPRCRNQGASHRSADGFDRRGR